MVTPGALFGVRPDDGSLAWLERFERVSGYMVTPMLLDDGRLFVSTPDVGSRAYALRHDGGKTVLEQVWHSRKLRMAFMNPVQIGEYIIGSSGPNPGILTAIDAASGERVWADRSFAQATLLCADGKLILLDENGNLALGMVTRDGFTVRSRCKVTQKESYTVPSLVETTLYVRDRKHIMALDLG